MHSYEDILKYVNDDNYVMAKTYLEDNIREESARKSGATSSDLVIIKRLFKENKCSFNDKAQPFELYGEKYYAFVNGHCILACQNAMGYEIQEENPFKMLQFMKGIDKNSSKFNAVNVDKSDVKSFKKIIKAEKRQTPYILTTEDGMIGVNATYLADALDFVDTNGFYVVRKEGGYPSGGCIDPLVFWNDENHRFAVVLPVHVRKENMEKAS